MTEQAEKVGLCDGCNYSLRGLSSNRCPECGRPFNPNDPKTMNMGQPMGRSIKLLLAPVGTPTNSLSVVAVAGMLWGGLLPFGPYVFDAAAALGFAILAYQILRNLVRRLLARIYSQSIVYRRRLPWTLSLIAAFISSVSGATFFIAVWLHRPLLDRYARHVYEDVPLNQAPMGPTRIGVLLISDVHVSPTGVSLRFGDGCVIRYIDAGSNQFLTHISGRWFFEGWWPWPPGLNRARDG